MGPEKKQHDQDQTQVVGFDLERRGRLQKQTVTLEINQLPVEEKELLANYKPLEQTVWTETGKDFSYATAGEYQIVLLASGLISNDQQWDNPEQSFVEGLYQRLARSQIVQLDSRPIAIVAVSCPGFGGTGLRNPEQVTDTELVSSRSYATILQILREVLQPQVIAGHSAGGEAVLEWSLRPDADLPTVAFHPSISEGKQTIFDLIRGLNSFNLLANRIPGVDRLAATIEKKIMEQLVAGSETQATEAALEAQLKVHLHEAVVHFVAYQLKNKELAAGDTFDLKKKFNAESGALVLVGNKDVLTSAHHTQAALIQLVESIAAALGSSVTVSVPEGPERVAIAKQVLQALVAEGEWGHDEIFMAAQAQAQAIEMVVKQFEQSVVQNTTHYHFMRGILKRLKAAGVPVVFRLADKTSLAQERDGLRETALKWERLDNEELAVSIYRGRGETEFAYKLEQKLIAYNWQEIGNKLKRLASLFDFDTETYPELVAEVKTAAIQQLNVIAKLLFNTESVQYYLTKLGLSPPQTMFELKSKGVFHSMFYQGANISNAPDLIPRSIWTNQANRMDFRLQLDELFFSILGMDTDGQKIETARKAIETITALLTDLQEELDRVGETEISLSPEDLLALSRQQI